MSRIIDPPQPNPEPRALGGRSHAAAISGRVPPLLRERDFGRLWTAETISFFGDQVTFVALPLVAVIVLDASAAEMGLLTAAGTLPNLLFSLHAGAAVDRRGRRRATMIATDLVRALLLATVPLAYWLGALTLAHLYVVAFVTGAASVVFGVASTALFAAVVPRTSYVEGTALVRGSYSFSWVAGPSVGGLLVQTLAGPVALVVDAVSFVASAVLLRSIAPAEPPAASETDGRVLDGLRFVRRTSALLARLGSLVVANFFYSMYFALLFLFAARELELPASVIGAALGAGAVGALVGSAVTTRISRRVGVGVAFIVGSFLYPAALVLVPFAPSSRAVAVAFLVAAEFLSGFGLMLCDITGSAIQHSLTPERLRSRVQGAHMTLGHGARSAGALAGGGLGTLIGVRPTLTLAAVGGAATVLFLLASPLRRMHDLLDEAES